MAINPLKQFEIKQIGSVNLGGIELAVTNQAVWTMGTTAVLCAFLIMASRGRQMVPGGAQNVLEVVWTFIEDMITSTTGKEGLKYFPFVFALFTFILVANLSGMIPGSYTATSQITITAAFALLVFLMVWVIGFMNHGLKFFTLFAPSGVAKPMLVILVPLEMISFFARPLTLSVRLMANMLAGHILLKVFASFAVMMIGALGFVGILGAIVPGIALLAISALEVFVALIQAYIFTLLTCIYLNDAIHLH